MSSLPSLEGHVRPPSAPAVPWRARHSRHRSDVVPNRGRAALVDLEDRCPVDWVALFRVVFAVTRGFERQEMDRESSRMVPERVRRRLAASVTNGGAHGQEQRHSGVHCHQCRSTPACGSGCKAHTQECEEEAHEQTVTAGQTVGYPKQTKTQHRHNECITGGTNARSTAIRME